MQISEKHIQLIDWDLRRRGVSNASLRGEMVDHICILLEEEPETAADFKLAYGRVIKKFESFRIMQMQTQKEVDSTGLGYVFFKITDYFFTLFYILLGLFSLILPIALIFYHPIDIFFLLAPLLVFGYLICFKCINYRKFEMIPFKKVSSQPIIK